MKNQSCVWHAVGISPLTKPEVQDGTWWEKRPERLAGLGQAGLGSQAQEWALRCVFGQPLVGFK